MADILIIIPCGLGKIWDKHPNAGAIKANDAYTGAPFKVNREFAERFSDRWVILNAKYGFIDPDFIIAGPYNVSFKKKSTEPIEIDTLIQQIRKMGLNKYGKVVGLGGKEYRWAMEAAFKTYEAEVQFPFAGLPIGKAMRAIKEAIKPGSWRMRPDG